MGMGRSLGITVALAAALGACARAPSGGGANAHAGHNMAAMGTSAGAGAVTAGAPVSMTAAEAARLGITVVAARSADLARTVRLVGQVVPAETAVRTVTTKVDGFVERLYVDFTGREVQRGEPLFDLYSPMLVAAQEELLLAVRLRNQLGTGFAPDAGQSADSLVAAARRRLQYWDVDDDQIAELERTGTVRRTITIRAPVGGVVLEKSITQGQAIMVGAPLFRLADLGTVWVEADVFERDLAAVRVGQAAEVLVDAYPGAPTHGRVGYLYPTVDAATRTGRVRIEVANAAGRLRPGLFASVDVRAVLGERGIVIPRQAALATGDRQVVFVEMSPGRFVPRFIILGAEGDSVVQVREGLREGERVVATAAFLLDAESNLGAAMAGMAGMAGAPTGAGTPPAAPAANPHAGHTVR